MMKKTMALLLLLTSAQGWAATKVEDVRLTAAADASRLVLNLSNAPTYKIFTLADPSRVVIDLSDASLAALLPNNFSGSPVQTVRSGIRNGHDLRMVVDLSAKVTLKSFVLQPSDKQGYRLVVDLGQVGIAPVATAPSPQAIPVAAAVAPTPNPQPVLAAAAKAAPALANNSPEAKLRDIIVAIDAGHGGVDPGAHGPRGVREKDVVLAIAHQLESQLRAEPGIRPVMIRDDDRFVSLRMRVTKARESKADLLISVHADAINDPSASGSSVYVLSDRGASSEAARWLAEKENAADLAGGISLDDKDDVLRSVLLDLSQTATLEASANAGSKVLQELRGVGRLHRHHIEQAGFVVLKAPDIPSMLVETAFISNPQEEAKLQSPSYQKQLADAIVDGVRAYFRENAPPGTKIAMANSMRQYVIAKGDTLGAIADRYGVSIGTLRVSNNLTSDRLYIGAVLRIPPSDGT